MFTIENLNWTVWTIKIVALWSIEMCTQPSNVGLDLSIFEFDQQMLKLIHQIGCVWKQGIPNPLNMTRSRLLAGHEMFLHQNGRKGMYKPTRSISGHVFYSQWVHIFGTPMAFFQVQRQVPCRIGHVKSTLRHAMAMDSRMALDLPLAPGVHCVSRQIALGKSEAKRDLS